ncbi:sarcoplasmic calcium-binding protein, alpha chain-like [Daphnia carinata]|uniref:sarcoplasmic calcium-binding protein, alpha chain-like n=1 Tax=Daphnia carinata TaxID=120202 RepID=UPI00257A6D43|nr:sarcoplasmic calcium-binding protein, alpha chain-like [Daphnia carinata]
MDDYTKRLVLCFSEKLDQAKVGYIEWDSFKLMAMRATFQQCGGSHQDDVYQKYLQQSKLWWDSLVRDVGADAHGRVHYVDMSNYVRRISKDAKDFEQLPEFIKNLANLVFLMNDKKADGKWDLEEYRNGAVGWCRYVTGINDIDAAYETLLTAKDVDRTISFERYKELVVEFFTSEDSNTPARHIFGPLELANIDLALTTSSKQ